MTKLTPAGLLFLLLSGLALPATVRAEQAEAANPETTLPTLVFRPHGGVGWASCCGADGNGLAVHGGRRVLLSAGPTQQFGVEVTYLDLDVSGFNSIDQQYLSVGIVLDLKLWGHFMMGIGTVGYVGLGDTNGNPFGLATNLGWEPEWDWPALPFATLRSEWVFADHVYSIMSISVCVTFPFSLGSKGKQS